MKLPLKIASIAFIAATFVVLVLGLCLIWLKSVTESEFLWRIFGSAFLLMFIVGYCIAVRDALARIRRNSDRASADRTDE